MRAFGLLPGDLAGNASFWAEQRRRIDAGGVEIAIVGDSRILFDTDLGRFERLTGVRPVQLALQGTNARPLLENLAADSDFKGLAIVGIADLNYFREEIGLMANALDRHDFESPAQRSSFVLHRALSRIFGFLDGEYRLSILVQRLDKGLRTGTTGPYNTPWKISTTGEERQTFLWSRIETDADLNAHARFVWTQPGRIRPPVTDDVINRAQTATRAAVAAIRARGGDVVFLRPPSTGQVRENEERRVPRTRGWDALLKAAGVEGIHADDEPLMRDLDLPELSHLSRACATVYTDAYVRAVATLTDRVRLRSDAPPPLAARDCRSWIANRRSRGWRSS